jgi:type I restriction enzyme S subunit
MSVPQLRFLEFSEHWRDNNLGAISDSISSGKDKNDPDGKYNLYGSTGVIGKTSSDTYKGKFILVARVGANAGLLTVTNGTFGVTDNTLIVCLKKIVNLDFIYYYLESLSLNKLVFGSGQPLITGGQLKALHFFLPDYPEQQKIADCLSSLSDHITLETQKLDTLKAHKKGLMQQLFPAEGETLPKLRFPEFHDSGEWIEKSLGDLDIYISDGNYGEKYPKAEEMKTSGIPFIRANNIKHSRLIWNDMRYIDADLHILLASGHLEEHEILVTTRGDIGMIAYVTNDFHGANINAQICLLRCGKDLNSYCLMQYLSSNKCYRQFQELQTGSALKQLPKKNLAKIIVNLPSLPEQQKIADCLSSLDELITAHTQKIDTLKLHKKGLMQQLFPSVEEVKE